MRKIRLAFVMTLSTLMALQSLLSPISVWAEVANAQPSPSLESSDHVDQLGNSSETIDGSQTIDQMIAEEDSEAGEVASSPEVPRESVQNDMASASTVSVDSVSYAAHVQDIGWQRSVCDGATAGTTGRSKRIEAICVSLLSKDGEELPNSSISVQSHISGIGWEVQPAGNCQVSGTTGQSRAIEALKIKLSDELSASYDIWYRVHSANFGWLGWAKNGEPAGSQGYARRAEALQIKVLPKGSADAPQQTVAFKDRTAEPPSVTYRTHVSNVGWMGNVSDGKTSGYAGGSNAIEALEARVNWYGHKGQISSRAHVAGIGWQNWTTGTAGTTGRSKAVEAFQFKLSGEAANSYDVWYRVYSSKLGGWLGWASNGSSAGSAGKSAAIQGIQVRLVAKGDKAPGSTDGRFVGDVDSLRVSALNLNRKSLGSKSGKTVVLGSEKGKAALGSLAINIENQDLAGSVCYAGLYEYGGWTQAVADGAQLNALNNGRALKGVRMQLSGMLSHSYDIWYRCCDSKGGWLDWACNGADSGSSVTGSYLIALEIRILNKGAGEPGSVGSPFVAEVASNSPHVIYQAHSANQGWGNTVSDGDTAGITGESLSLQALNVSLSNIGDDSGVEVKAHVANNGWQNWVSSSYAGTVGQNKAIQAVQLRLTGSAANKYDIYYRVHSARYGWLGWANNGSSAGTTGLGLQAEAIQIKLVAKGDSAPSSSEPPCVTTPAFSVQAHVSNIGWMNPVGNGGVAGTSGRSLGIEALKLCVSGEVSGGIECSSHVQGIGWQNWVSGGEVSGTVGQSRRVEAVKIRLTGNMTKYFDVWYRAYCQDYGWMGWTCNGQPAGTSKVGYRLESLQVKIVPKGAGAPGSTSYPFTDQPAMSYEMRSMLNRANWYSSKTGWLVMVDRTNCRLGVFRGARGSWRYAQHWACSTGAPGTPTPAGEYSVTGKGYSFGNGYTCYYYTQFYGDYLIHSGTYYQGTFRVMDDRMGMHISHGCVRLLLDRAKWVWDNVPIGSKVVIY